MVQIPAHVKQQLKLLRTVSASVAENAPAGIVDVRIKDLKPQDFNARLDELSNIVNSFKQKIQL